MKIPGLYAAVDVRPRSEESLGWQLWLEAALPTVSGATHDEGPLSQLLGLPMVLLKIEEDIDVAEICYMSNWRVLGGDLMFSCLKRTHLGDKRLANWSVSFV